MKILRGLWQGFCPDEIKIYPNQLLANAELYEYWQRGEFHPYTTEELIDLIADIKPSIPRYCPRQPGDPRYSVHECG